MDKPMELLQGTLDMLIPKAVSLGPPLHGYMDRLEHQGWITSKWGESEKKRKAKCCRLTAAGKCKMQTEREKCNRMADVTAGILRSTREEV